ncbi:hypothetical protein Tsubulata_012522 [Turnera subulata]|uniref:Bifunctional inhibitor/plant lipid transfer protein/seed storage helical domain-containing protein n=1 Tax=Turnera subulata TaxID=218843 RepID=A0A9Q0F5K0_9ROSI|nr:hypothetical protein Tsubulata_012522 [Turnera subulata]
MRNMKVAFLVVLVILGVDGVAKASAAAPSPAQCKQERNLGINACKPIVYGKPASPECCERIRVSHIECVCPVVNAKLAALVDVNRFVRIIEGCGRRVPRHYKCGSITTP